MSVFDRFICGITGHGPARKHAQDGRLYLRCECGWESAGWQIMKPKPIRRIVPLRWVQDERARRRA